MLGESLDGNKFKLQRLKCLFLLITILLTLGPLKNSRLCSKKYHSTPLIPPPPPPPPSLPTPLPWAGAHPGNSETLLATLLHGCNNLVNNKKKSRCHRPLWALIQSSYDGAMGYTNFSGSKMSVVCSTPCEHPQIWSTHI